MAIPSRKLVIIIISALSLAVAGTLLSVIFVVQPVRFEGKSMTPALNDGDRILILKSFWQPQRGDVVAFYYPKDTTKSYVKRIVGLPNETIEINGGKVIINGNQLTETYVSSQQNMSLVNFPPLPIPSHKYYVLGDNRDHSSDSRIWGMVSEELIYGKYIFRYEANPAIGTK